MDIFDPAALGLIARVSLGIPRVVNNICDNALLQGYAVNSEVISRDIIEDVIDVLDISTNDMTTSDDLEFNQWASPKHFTAIEGSRS